MATFKYNYSCIVVTVVVAASYSCIKSYFHSPQFTGFTMDGAQRGQANIRIQKNAKSKYIPLHHIYHSAH